MLTIITAAGEALLRATGCDGTRLPLIITPQRVIPEATPGQLAEYLGMSYRRRSERPTDLVVIGAGPAGLAAGVYGASEGLATVVLALTPFVPPTMISFPPAAAFAHPKAGTEITPSMIPSVSQYAGQQLLTGQQAEAYADHFIAVHIANMTGGKTYAQLSTESLAQPNNTQLAATVSTVFKGETLRSMLLNAYGWWKVSQITYIIALVMFGLGTVAAAGSLLGFARIRRERPGAVVFASAPAIEQITQTGHQADTTA